MIPFDSARWEMEIPLVGRMKSLSGGFGEEGGRQVGWRGEVTRYFVDREIGGREGTGDQHAGG